MAGKTLFNIDEEQDKVSWDLAADELWLGWICLVQEPDMSG
jgi:hypothetical protein